MPHTDKLCRIEAGPVWATLLAPPEGVALVDAALTVEVGGARYSAAYRAGHWDGTRKFLLRPGPRFLAGLADRVAGLLQEAGHAVEVRRATSPAVSPHAPGVALHGIVLRPYQLEAAGTALERRRLVLELATGGGKTEIGAEIIRAAGLPALWLTHRRDLALQTRERLRTRLRSPIGLVGAGDHQVEDVTVGMVPTLARPFDPAFFRRWGVLIFDEVHHGGAESWVRVAGRCTEASIRVGLSGTPWTHDAVRDLTLEGVVGPCLKVVEEAQLVRDGFLARPRIVFLQPPPASFPSYREVRDAVLPDWRLDPRRLSALGTRLWGDAYERGVTQNEARTSLFVATAHRHARAGERVLVLCSRIPHAARLFGGLDRVLDRTPHWLLSGETPTEERDRVLLLFRQLSGGAVLVATPFFREGMDVPEIDVLALAGADLSEIAVLQARGRAMRPRPDKTHVLIYDSLDGRDPRDPKDYLANHTKARLALYTDRGYEIRRSSPS